MHTEDPKSSRFEGLHKRSSNSSTSTPTTRSAVTFSGCTYFIPAPFLQDAIINTDSDDPLELIP
eukprot:428138-Ditylum_brightwellii.AAC.1